MFRRLTEWLSRHHDNDADPAAGARALAEAKEFLASEQSKTRDMQSEVPSARRSQKTNHYSAALREIYGRRRQ